MLQINTEHSWVVLQASFLTRHQVPALHLETTGAGFSENCNARPSPTWRSGELLKGGKPFYINRIKQIIYSRIAYFLGDSLHYTLDQNLCTNRDLSLHILQNIHSLLSFSSLPPPWYRLQPQPVSSLRELQNQVT